MEITEDMHKLIESLLSLKPMSVFLYGSRCRNDYLPSSDYEVGVFFTEGAMVDEKRLQQVVKKPFNYRVYPYEVTSFSNGQLLIPFEESVFVRSITLSGKTIWGERLVEDITGPPITVSSLAREVKFQLGRASDALVCHQQGCRILAEYFFVKSCLWGTRCLIILTQQRFPITYQEIVETASDLDLGGYEELPKLALISRQTGTPVSKSSLLDNIWYLNHFIEKQIMDLHRKEGDIIVLP